MNLAKGNKVADLGGEDARKQVWTKRRDGTTRLEKVPSGQFVKVVKPSGAVDRVPVHNGRASEMGDDDPYKFWIEQKLWKSGSVPYGKCPQTLPYEIMHGCLPTKWYRGGLHPVIPEHMRDRTPCRAGVNGGPINMGNCCACIEELIEYRKKWQDQQMRKVEVTTDAMIQKEAAAKGLQASEGLVSAVAGLADVVKSMKEGSERTPVAEEDDE